MEQAMYFLEQKDMPTQWYNIQADLPEPLPPYLHPMTKGPLGPEDLAPLFPMELIKQEVSTERWIDIPEEIQDIYRTWRPYYTEQLRAAIGEDLLLVGNSGGPLVDPHLNGITLEGVGDRFEVLTARGYFHDQAAVSHSPFMAVAWATTVASEAPSWELAPEVPGLHYGYIITGR